MEDDRLTVRMDLEFAMNKILTLAGRIRSAVVTRSIKRYAGKIG